MSYNDQSREIFVAIVAVTIIFLLFAGFFIAYLILYWKRKVKYVREMAKMKTAFDEELLCTRLEMQEQTFSYISGEIHDNVGQLLSLAKVQLSVIEQSERFDKVLLRETKETITQSLADLRDMAHSLDGERIRAFSLSDSIEKEAARLTKSGHYEVSVNRTGNVEDIPDDHRLLLFRVIQEGLQNIVKHANATTIFIGVRRSDHQIDIFVIDNGIGFPSENAAQYKKGVGLSNMQKRIGLMNGTLEINASPGSGTRLSIHIPYE